jgi:putative salt-induced outer membrane protein YdiY
MTRLRAILPFGLVLAFASLAGAQQASVSGGDQHDIRAREAALATAMHARDAAGLDALLASDYVLRSVPDVDRTTWIRNAVTLCWGDRSDMDRFRTQRHDRVVVATFEMTFYQDPRTCRPAVLRSEITDVWVEHPDGWRLQVRHASPPPAGDAGIASQYGLVPVPPPTWDISSELSFVATSGNTATRTTGIGGEVTHRARRATSHASLSYLSSAADGVTNARAFSIRARHGFELGQHFQIFGEGAYDRDQFSGIDGRTTGTFGLGYSPVTAGRHRLTIEAGVGVTAEERVGLDVRFATASGTGHYLWTIAPGARFTEEAAFTGDLESGMNWRQTSVTAFTVALSRLLSFKASHSIEYRNQPVPGFGRTDMRTSAAMVLSLQHRPSAR